jgi:Ca2+-binding RTX toxin-like protein
MALVSSGNPLTGTSGDDYLIAYEGTTNPNTIIDAGDGNDVVYGDYAAFFTNLETSAANVGTAITTAPYAPFWTRSENDDITSSTTVSHATLFSDGSLAGQQGWFAVTVVAGQQITLDVDHGGNATGNNTDTEISIYATNGTTQLAYNDDGPVDAGSNPGSINGNSYDSFLTYTFLAAGTYFIRIGDFSDANGNFSANDSFVLNISLTGQAAATAALSGNDTIDGGSGNDVLHGMGGNDVITGGLGVDRVTGGSGDDRFVHNSAAENGVGEIYDGGAGKDTLKFNGSGSYIYNLRDDVVSSIENIKLGSPGAGNSATLQLSSYQFDGLGFPTNLQIEVSTVNTVTNIIQIYVVQTISYDFRDLTFVNTANAPILMEFFGNYEENYITATAFNDVISGGAGGDTINGWSGNDMIYGGVAAVDTTETGDDLLSGGDGNDTIYGNGGHDFIFGGLGEDFLIGGTGDDTIFGGSSAADTIDLSNDFIRGGIGDDNLYGNGGDDTILGGAQGDDIYGGNGNDIIYGGAFLVDASDGWDTIFGGAGNDEIRGNGGDDQLYGEDGDDTIIGGLGQDEIHGGTGNDYLRGGADKDFFVFDTALNATTNVDIIQAFSTADFDNIVLSRAIFVEIGFTFDSNEFRIGTAAIDNTDRIIYNQVTGQIYYDSDGFGGDPQTLFAVMTVVQGQPFPELDYFDFFTVA